MPSSAVSTEGQRSPAGLMSHLPALCWSLGHLKWPQTPLFCFGNWFLPSEFKAESKALPKSDLSGLFYTDTIEQKKSYPSSLTWLNTNLDIISLSSVSSAWFMMTTLTVLHFLTYKTHLTVLISPFSFVCSLPVILNFIFKQLTKKIRF